ncbi:uncharacterized protein LOC135388439 isoform X2 [Ornithodoros turicata]|uniref:uncharacterized protein LOC135388439 isoform X2 n=1 Tax=Ornithodoros turicata TaxID=34597 RepID=UPI00313992AD
MSDTPPRRFTIVKFPNEENQVAVVPSSWVVDTSCFWPPEKEQRKVGLYVRKEKAPGTHWQFLDCEQMETYGTYEEARQMLPPAASTLDLNGDREYGRGKRPRIRKALSDYDDDDDTSLPATPPHRAKPRYTTKSNVNTEQAHEKQRLLVNLSEDECSLPATPPRRRMQKACAGDDCNSQESSYFRPPVSRLSSSYPSTSKHLQGHHKHTRPQVKVTGSSTQAHRQQREASHRKDSPTQLDNLCGHEQLERNNVSARFSYNGNADQPTASLEVSDMRAGLQDFDDSDTPLFIKHSEHRAPQTPVRAPPQPPQYNSEFEKKVLRTMHIVTLRLLEHSDQLDTILSCLQQPKDMHDEDIIVPGPFTDAESFLKFDKDVEESNAKKQQLRTYMMRLGGTSNADRARRILYALLADNVGQQFNWTGAGRKRKFSSLECCNIMCTAINKATDSGTVAETEKAIQSWLRHARERAEKKVAKTGTAP